MEDAEEGVAGLKPLDSQEANYWMAVVCAMKRNLPDGFKLATQLLENVRRCVLCIYCISCSVVLVCLCPKPFRLTFISKGMYRIMYCYPFSMRELEIRIRNWLVIL